MCRYIVLSYPRRGGSQDIKESSQEIEESIVGIISQDRSECRDWGEMVDIGKLLVFDWPYAAPGCIRWDGMACWASDVKGEDVSSIGVDMLPRVLLLRVN